MATNIPSSMNGHRPPFTLPSNVILFHDWRYVDHSYLGWMGPEEQALPLWPAPDPMPAVHVNYRDVPTGVRIEAMPCRFDTEPVLVAADLDERILMNGSVLYEDGRYRLFYGSFDADTFSNPEKRELAGFTQSLRYAESDNGTDWRFPPVGVSDGKAGFENAVFKPDSGWHGGCVFHDPDAPAAERYKALYLGCATAEQLERYRERRPEEIDPMSMLRKEHPMSAYMAAFALFGAVSPDGLSWTPLQEPLLVQHSDTFQACTRIGNEYVAYLRSWCYGRRSVAIATGRDFREFGNLRQCLWPGADVAAADTWYTPGYTTVPEAPDYHLMFATRWSQQDDEFVPILHASPDGHTWCRVPGDVLPAHDLRPVWSRCGFAMGTLNPLPGDRVGSLVGGWHVPHKFPRAVPFGQLGWVWWPRDRVTALRAERGGRFCTWPLHFSGREMVLNYRTRASGHIRVSTGISGRELEACDVISGDETARVVTWQGQPDLGHAEGEPVRLQFELQNADLFSIRFR